MVLTKTFEQVAEFQYIPIEDIKIDFSYQRIASPRFVHKIVKEYDEMAAGHLMVNVRENGEIYLIDGQHRLMAKKKLGHTHAPCQVVYGLTVQEEAKEFTDRNSNIKGTSALERYHAELIMNDPKALQLKGILDGFGLVVAREFGYNTMGLHCVHAMLAIIHRYGPEAFRRTLSLMIETWPDQKETALTDRMMWGVSIFLNRHEEKYNRDRFVRVVGRIDPITIGSQATANKHLMGSQGVYKFIADVLASYYDFKLRGDNRLVPSEWTTTYQSS